MEYNDLLSILGSGDTGRIAKLLDLELAPFLRYLVLTTIIKESYKKRKSDPSMGILCENMSYLYISEFPTRLAPALYDTLNSGEKSARLGTLPYKYLATVLSEKGDYNKAIEVCEDAISHGYNDCTQGGFEGRILKIKKMQVKNKIIP